MHLRGRPAGGAAPCNGLAASRHHLGKVGKQKATTLVPNQQAQAAHVVHTFEAVLATVFALRALMQRFVLDGRVAEQAKSKAERLERAAHQLHGRLR